MGQGETGQQLDKWDDQSNNLTVKTGRYGCNVVRDRQVRSVSSDKYMVKLLECML